MLNKALEALEDENAGALQDVLKGTINFNRKIGQHTLDDDTLADFIQNFDKIPLKDSDFEFPDLLGAAYEWLIKYFADSAGKKAGEFYTPAEVVRICVEICEPQDDMRVYDPTVGSGGMLIQVRDYVREKGLDAGKVSLFGQEKMGTTWSICKMNMLLHGIPDADIRQQDTLREPQHQDDTGDLRRFDRVLANPPFSQNYIKKDIKFPGRFPVWMPEKGKKADLMFVQHMLAVLKSDGRLATVMPHGVLFRGGEEREARQHFIDKRYLEAVIGWRGAAPAGAVHQRRPRIPRRQSAKPPARRRHRQDRPRLPRRGGHTGLRPLRAAARDQGRRLQLQHPPLCGQRSATRTARCARAPARRRAGERGRWTGPLLAQLPGPARELL
jgi:type I restriction enzyme M protein